MGRRAATPALPAPAPRCATRRTARWSPSWPSSWARRTNNYAEWTAVALALEEAKLLGASRVDLRMDSQLVARQISGMYRVKHPDLKPIHAQVMELLAGFDGYTVGHVPRELNKEADRLSNVAIDQPGS